MTSFLTTLAIFGLAATAFTIYAHLRSRTNTDWLERANAIASPFPSSPGTKYSWYQPFFGLPWFELASPFGIVAAVQGHPWGRRYKGTAKGITITSRSEPQPAFVDANTDRIVAYASTGDPAGYRLRIANGSEYLLVPSVGYWTVMEGTSPLLRIEANFIPWKARGSVEILAPGLSPESLSIVFLAAWVTMIRDTSSGG